MIANLGLCKNSCVSQMARSMLPVLCVLCTFCVALATAELFPPGIKRIELEEKVCQLSMHARVYIYLEDNHTPQAYFQDSLLSWNGDPSLYEINTHAPLVSTDIQSALTLRKSVTIKNNYGQTLVVAEQVLFDKLFNPASIFRGYTLYDHGGQHIGSIEKVEIADTEMTVYDVDGIAYARARKPAFSKLKSLLCVNPRWEIDIFDGHDANNALTDVRVLSTLIAIKAIADINAAATQRGELLDMFIGKEKSTETNT